MPALSSFGGLSAIGRGQRAGAHFAATGGTITTDGLYTVHTFTSSGYLTVLSGEKNVEVLVIGGGGSGGCIDSYGCGGITGYAYGVGGQINADGGTGPSYSSGSQNAAGGGGGGGCAQWASMLISETTAVTVGAGGSVGSNNATASVFGAVTSNGGTRGYNAASHNSGPGGAGGPKGTGTGGTTTPGGITYPGTYGVGGHGASQAWSVQPGANGVVIVRYLTA